MSLITLGQLPNMRRLIIPDPGYVFIDMDLSRADAQVVAWDSGDETYKQQFRDEWADPEKDMHAELAMDFFKKVNYQNRQYAKVFRHGWTYLAAPRTLAAQCNLSTIMANRFAEILNAKYPGITLWHERIKQQLYKNRTVNNAFGYHRVYFDRVDSCLTDAVAWIPQSTVGHVINRALCAIAESPLKASIKIMLQNHDSLVMQIRKNRAQELLGEIEKMGRVVIPYKDPLTIPVGFKASDKSWGDCHAIRRNASNLWEITDENEQWHVLQ